MRHITDVERRARLAVRHALSPNHAATDPTAAADAVVALHGSDPATTVLSALLRAPGHTPPDVETVLYEERSLVRVLAMRRTVFAVRAELAPACVAASDGVARAQRRTLLTFLASNGFANPDVTVAQAEAEALSVFDELAVVTTKDLTERSELLATMINTGNERWPSSVSLASRMLLVLSTRGEIVRGRPRGGWTSTQFAWSRADRWSPHLSQHPTPEDAAVTVARSWLARYGPATADDLQWWTGWTKGRTTAALAALELTEVETSAGASFVLADDLEPVVSPGPWVALLPALDPTSMGWKHRHHLVGDHRAQVFDSTGNAGPTAWLDGRVVGGWAQRDDGEVVVHLLEDVGSQARAEFDERAAALTNLLGDVRLKPRARRWTPIETVLRR